MKENAAKVWFWGVVLGLLGLILSAGVVLGVEVVGGRDEGGEGEAGPVELVRTDVEVGWEPGAARVRLPGWVPFHARLQNDQQVTVRGRLRVEGLMVPDHPRGALCLEYPVELAPGSVKLFHDVVFVQKGVGSVRVRIDWEAGVEGRFEKVFPLVLLAEDSRLVLHCAPETVPGQWMRTGEKGLSLLERVVVPGALTDLDRIPRRWQEYAGVDVIFLEGGSWTGWAREQVTALREWVLEGGHLMVAPGTVWPVENEAVLGDLLPGRYGSSRVLPAGAQVSFLPREAVVPWRAGRGVTFYPLEAVEGYKGEVVRSWLFPDRAAAVVTARMGRGRVTQWAFSPSVGGIPQWVGIRLFLHVLMGEDHRGGLNPLGVGQAGNLLLWAKGNALALLPTRDRVGLLLVVYLGGVLPFLYLFSRLIGRRVVFWFLLPLISVGLGLLFLRRAPPSELAVRELTIREGAAGGRYCWDRTAVHVQSPVPDEYEVVTERGMAVPVRVWPMVDDDDEEVPVPSECWVTRTDGRTGRTEGIRVGANDSVTFSIAGCGVEGEPVSAGFVWEVGKGWVLRMGGEEGVLDGGLVAFGDRVWLAQAGPLGVGWSLDAGSVPSNWPRPLQELAGLIRGGMPLGQPTLYRWAGASGAGERTDPRTGLPLGPIWTVEQSGRAGGLPAQVDRLVLEERPLHPRGLVGQGVVRDEWEVEFYRWTGIGGGAPQSPYRAVGLGLWDGILQVTPKDFPPGIPHFLSLRLTVRLANSGQAGSLPEVEIYDLANDRWVVLNERVLKQLQADPTPVMHPLRGVFWIRVPGVGFPLDLEVLQAHLEARVWSD